MKQFSFSKLEKYLKCSWWYFLRHVKGIFVQTDSDSTVAGTIVHETLEEFYGPTINRSMAVLDILDIVWMNRLLKLDLLPLVEQLQGIARDISHMDVRAAKGYKGLDAILDPDGKPYKSPKQSKAWGKAMEALNLPARQKAIDDLAASKDKLWQAVSLTSVYAMTYMFLTGYIDNISAQGLTVLAQELVISLPPAGSPKGSPGINMVYFPNGDAYTGKIDMIAQDAQGRLYLIDHKTSKDEPSYAKVAHWEQLLLYAWAHHQLWGRWPDFIAINSIKHKSLIIAKFDPSLVPAAVERAMMAIKGIDSETFIQQSPVVYGSNCYNEYTKTPCEFFGKECHKEYAQQMGVRVA